MNKKKFIMILVLVLLFVSLLMFTFRDYTLSFNTGLPVFRRKVVEQVKENIAAYNLTREQAVELANEMGYYTYGVGMDPLYSKEELEYIFDEYDIVIRTRIKYIPKGELDL